MDDTDYPSVLAQRSDGALLIALDARRGCIYRPTLRRVSPSLVLAMLLSQPYWRAYSGSQNVLRNWPGPLPTPGFPRPNPTPDDAA